MTLSPDDRQDIQRRIRLSSGSGPGFAWEMAEVDLDPRLAPFALRITGYAEWSAEPIRRLEAPNAGIPIIIGFGAPLRVSGVSYALEKATAFIAGLDIAAATTEGQGFQAGVQLDLTPLGAARLLGMPLAAIAHNVVALDDILGAPAKLLVQRLGEGNDWESRLKMTEEFALHRIAANPAPPALVAEIWRRLMLTGGLARVAEMASDIGVSRKHLTRQFHDWLGLAPSAFSRVLRFDRAVAHIRRTGGRVDWGRLAQECGYFDQPHFNRDFRAFTGMTPGAYVAALQPTGAIVLAGATCP